MTQSSKPDVRTPVDAVEQAFVARLTTHLTGGVQTPVLIGEGFNCWVYRLGERVLKLGKPHRAAVIAEELQKELWCAAAARSVGVPTPEALAFDNFEDRPFLLQAFVAGRPPTPEELPELWEAMGRFAATYHALPVEGFGPKLAAPGRFAQNWDDHLAYNLACLGPDDPLTEMGVISAAVRPELKRRFEALAARTWATGLCHADLAPWNILVAGDGAMTLIDWGCARGGPVPEQEVTEMIRDGRGGAGAVEGFARGYGLDAKARAALETDVVDFLLLREIDTLRWALERSPADVPGRRRRALEAVGRIGAV
jgi:Ser/Thr protein kinase RdoA (MazF antagonist)